MNKYTVYMHWPKIFIEVYMLYRFAKKIIQCWPYVFTSYESLISIFLINFIQHLYSYDADIQNDVHYYDVTVSPEYDKVKRCPSRGKNNMLQNNIWDFT